MQKSLQDYHTEPHQPVSHQGSAQNFDSDKKQNILNQDSPNSSDDPILKVVCQDLYSLKTFHGKRLLEVKTLFGNDHHNTVTFMIRLAETYSRLKAYDEAIDLYSESLCITTSAYGEEHCSSVACYNRLAGAYKSKGDHEKSMELYYWSLELTKTVFGKQHVNTAALYSCLADTCRRLGNDDEAKEYKSQFLEVITKIKPMIKTDISKYRAEVSLSAREDEIKMLEDQMVRPNKNTATKDPFQEALGKSDEIVIDHMSMHKMSSYSNQNNINANYKSSIFQQISHHITHNNLQTIPNPTDCADQTKGATDLVDSHLTNELSLMKSSQCGDEDEDEIMIMGDVSDLAKVFFTQHTVVWYDLKKDSEESQKNLNRFSAFADVKAFRHFQQAAEYIQNSQVPCQVIISDDNWESFIHSLSDEVKVQSIYLYCEAKNFQEYDEKSKNYLKIAGVDEKFGRLVSKMHKHSLKCDFPAFAPVFTDDDTSTINRLYYINQGLLFFRNRKQAKTDFLSLCNIVYKDRKNIEKFTDTYNEYNVTDILKWYINESFFYKVINNCLRIATSDSILYSRLAVRDLFLAIIERFEEQDTHYSGLLYRGTYLSEQEWQSLIANTGKEIEMYGFLSTSKAKDVALRFFKKDPKRMVFITIIMPAAHYRGRRGFVDLEELSDYAEKEVLFNLKSRFTVLEAATESDDPDLDKCRHLVLLYASEFMRAYTAEIQPTINISVEYNEFTTACVKSCLNAKNSTQRDLLLINLSDQKEHIRICMQCMIESEEIKKTPYLCLTSTSDTLYSKVSIQKTVKGTVMQYQQGINIKFYQLQCQTKCSQTNKSRQFVCVDCTGTKKTWCVECFSTQKRMLEKWSHCGSREQSLYFLV